MSKQESDNLLNAGFIPGIYNFCDHWCEKCRLKSRCLSFVMEKKVEEKKNGNFEEGVFDKNENVWEFLKLFFDSTYEFLEELAKESLQVLRYIDEHYREGSLTELAVLMGYDVYWLSRAINRLLGRNYKELLQIKRLNQAAFLLHNTRMPVADVSFAVGYDNTSYFYRIFRTYYGMSPREYRKTG